MSDAKKQLERSLLFQRLAKEILPLSIVVVVEILDRLAVVHAVIICV